MNIPFKRYWDLLGPYLMLQKGRFVLLSVLLLGSISFQVVNPQIVRTFIDAALSGASQALLADEQVIAYPFRGKRYDCGSKLGYLEATVEYGLAHPELGADFANYLKGVVL